MKWKKGSFKIAVNPRSVGAVGDDGTRSGLVCAPWGINKMGNWFALTALSTGLAAGSFDRLSHAKDVAEKLVQLPIDWTLTSPLHDVPNDVRTRAQAIIRRQYA